MLGHTGISSVRLYLPGVAAGIVFDPILWTTEFHGLHGHANTQERLADLGKHLVASWNRNVAFFHGQNLDFGEQERRFANYLFFHLESNDIISVVLVKFTCNRNGSNPTVTYDFDAGSVFSRPPGILWSGHYKGIELVGNLPDDPDTLRFAKFLTDGIEPDDLTVTDAFMYFGNIIARLVNEHERKEGGPAPISKKIDAAIVTRHGVKWVVQDFDLGDWAAEK